MVVHLAYIDAGTGSIIWQTVAGTVLGAIYLSRKAIAHIATLGKARLEHRPKAKVAQTKTNSDVTS